MTSEELISKYGNMIVNFSSSCKYVFIYKAKLENGTSLVMGVGGSEEIYGYEFMATETVSSLMNTEIVAYVDLVNYEGETIESLYVNEEY